MFSLSLFYFLIVHVLSLHRNQIKLVSFLLSLIIQCGFFLAFALHDLKSWIAFFF